MAGFDYSLVDEAVNRVVEKFCPQKVIIFGSVAKKVADEFSDLDILVVMESDMEPSEGSADLSCCCRHSDSERHHSLDSRGIRR